MGHQMAELQNRIDLLEQGIQSRQLYEAAKHASINLTIDVVETSVPEKILASIE